MNLDSNINIFLVANFFLTFVFGSYFFFLNSWFLKNLFCSYLYIFSINFKYHHLIANISAVFIKNNYGPKEKSKNIQRLFNIINVMAQQNNKK